MPDSTNDENQAEEQNFADLLNSYGPDPDREVQLGDKISGPIISVGREAVFMDTGTKIDGVVDRQELLDENGELPFKEGDVLELYVVSLDANEIRLSKALSGVGAQNALRDAFEKGVPVEGKVRAPCKGGFEVDLLGRRAFCPMSQMDLQYVEEPDSYTGQSFAFLITRLEEKGRNIVISRRELLAREQEKAQAAFLAEVDVGDILEGRVTRLMPYGAFVELMPGLEGMAHLSELSWARVEKAQDVLQVGENIHVKIIGLDRDAKSGRLKIGLSLKQASGDPWENVAEKFKEGETVAGTVTRLARFGAFVEISPGIDGLVHLSEMSYKKHVVRPEEVVKPGDKVQVVVKQIDAAQRRISLSIKDAQGDPWIDVPRKYSAGQKLQGTLEKKESFGYFVSLEPGITGLLPKSKLKNIRRPAEVEKLKEGQSIAVVIEEIDRGERKITLAPVDSRDETDWQRFTGGGDQPLGALGSKLQAALREKEETEK